MLALSLLFACAEPDADAARQAWLVDALVQDNLTWLSRDPALLAHKYATMAADPYDWMRGAAGVFFMDISRPGTPRARTDFATTPGAAAVLLVGDPHPENLGSHRVGAGPGPAAGAPFEALAEGMVIDFNDLDGSHFGPYVLDLRRAATGLSLLAWPMEGCGEGCVDAMVRALAEGWLNGLHGEDRLFVDLLDAASRASSEEAATPRIATDLLVDAMQEGAERKRLNRYTAGEGEQRRILLDEAVDALGEGMVAPTPEERAQVQRLLAAHNARAERPLRLLDVARRYGSGVASQPAVRYVWLVDEGDEAPDDDRLIVVREVVDPPAPPGARPSLPGLFDSQADRIERAPRLLWRDPDTDVASLGLMDGGMAFKVVSWASWFQSFDHLDLAEAFADGDATEDDLVAFAGLLGATLGGAHARAPTAMGGPAGPDLLLDVEGREQALVDELVAVAREDAARCLADHALFIDALDALGPTLGAERLR